VEWIKIIDPREGLQKTNEPQEGGPGAGGPFDIMKTLRNKVREGLKEKVCLTVSYVDDSQYQEKHFYVRADAASSLPERPMVVFVQVLPNDPGSVRLLFDRPISSLLTPFIGCLTYFVWLWWWYRGAPIASGSRKKE